VATVEAGAPPIVAATQGSTIADVGHHRDDQREAWRSEAFRSGSIAGRTVVHHASDYWVFTPATVPGGGVVILASRITHW